MLFEDFRQWFQDWRLNRRGAAQLRDLDDHLLADLGIARRDIRRRAMQADGAPRQ